MLPPKAQEMVDRLRAKRAAAPPVASPDARDRRVYGCCGAPRRTPHTPDCPNVKADRKRQEEKTKQATRKKKFREFAAKDGAWVRMRRVEGIWSCSLTLPDGRVAEVEDGDWHWALDMLAARIADAE